MTENSAQTEQFTGLILLTGVDKPGIAASLFETLAPFSIHIIDVEQVINNHRLILTALIGANPAHQKAIEEDLALCASALDVDIATVFGTTQVSPMALGILTARIASPKMHAQAMALATQAIAAAGANIHSFSRTSDDPVTIAITISGLSKEALEASLLPLKFEDATNISVSDL
jgi:phosphoserine phosphatase